MFKCNVKILLLNNLVILLEGGKINVMEHFLNYFLCIFL